MCVCVCVLVDVSHFGCLTCCGAEAPVRTVVHRRRQSLSAQMQNQEEAAVVVAQSAAHRFTAAAVSKSECDVCKRKPGLFARALTCTFPLLFPERAG